MFRSWPGTSLTVLGSYHERMKRNFKRFTNKSYLYMCNLIIKGKGGIGTRLTNLCICYAMFKDFVPFYQSDVHLKLEHQTCLYTVDVLITAKPYLRGFVSGYKIPRTFLYLTRKNENWISTVWTRYSRS